MGMHAIKILLCPNNIYIVLLTAMIIINIFSDTSWRDRTVLYKMILKLRVRGSCSLLRYIST